MKKRFAIPVLLFSLGFPVPAGKGLRVLFIGNSLTYTNNLPAVVKSLLKQGGVPVDKVESMAEPNFGLEDHWSTPRTRRAIERGHWDFVILQQGPSATEGRPSLIEYTRKFADLIRAAGARPALYMVWPSLGRFGDFDGVSDSYRKAAKESETILLPAGEAWRAAWRKNQQLALYGADGFHPSPLGTYLAALVIYQGLSGKDPRQLPAKSPMSQNGWSEETVRQAQEAAAGVIFQQAR